MTRLTDLGVKSFLVASSLRAVVAQRLVRRVCPSCRRTRESTESEQRYLEQYGISTNAGKLSEGTGCDACAGTGYHGRVAIFEFFVIDPSIERMIHAGAGLAKLRKHARQQGMRTLREDGLRKAVEGITTIGEVIAATTGEALN